ncbi:unnamed protein product, partial [Vitis vinifera]
MHSIRHLKPTHISKTHGPILFIHHSGSGLFWVFLDSRLQREKNGFLLGSIRWECEIWWRKLAISSCAFDETALTHCHRPNSRPSKTPSYVKSYFQASQQACFCPIPTMLNLHPIGTIHYWQEFCPLVVHTRKRHYQYCCRLHFEVLGGNNMPATTRILLVYHHHDCIWEHG